MCCYQSYCGWRPYPNHSRLYQIQRNISFSSSEKEKNFFHCITEKTSVANPCHFRRLTSSSRLVLRNSLPHCPFCTLSIPNRGKQMCQTPAGADARWAGGVPSCPSKPWVYVQDFVFFLHTFFSFFFKGLKALNTQNQCRRYWEEI